MGQDYLSVDCFLEGRPTAEPTWERHVRVMCKTNQNEASGSQPTKAVEQANTRRHGHTSRATTPLADRKPEWLSDSADL